MSHRRRAAPEPDTFDDGKNRAERRGKPLLGPATPKYGLTVGNSDKERLVGDLRHIAKLKARGKA